MRMLTVGVKPLTLIRLAEVSRRHDMSLGEAAEVALEVALEVHETKHVPTSLPALPPPTGRHHLRREWVRNWRCG